MKDNEREKERQKIGEERGEERGKKKEYKKEKNEEKRDQGSESKNLDNRQIEEGYFFTVLIFMSTVLNTNFTGRSVNVTFHPFCKKKYEEQNLKHQGSY